MAVCLLVGDNDDVTSLLRWAHRFSRGQKTALNVLYVARRLRQNKEPVQVPFVKGDEEKNESAIIDRLRLVGSQIRDKMFEEAKLIESEHQKFVPPCFWMLEHENPKETVLHWVKEQKPDLLIVPCVDANDDSDFYIDHVDCQVLFLRAAPDSGREVSNVLIPVAGGPHGMAALRIIKRFTHFQNVQLDALYLQDPRADEAEAVGTAHLQKILKNAGVVKSERVNPVVRLGRDIRKEIAVALEGHDLVIIGASDQNVIQRMLHGTIGDHIIARASGGCSVAVLRTARPVYHRFMRLLDRLLPRWVPQMDRADRIDLFDNIANGSRCSFDFVALMLLSAAIAACGLILNSGAVVVGAMLVAPLMMPIVGAGLGVVQGNVTLVRESMRSIMIGFLLALIMGLAIGSVFGNSEINSELRARGGPNLLDFLVAVFSGIAGSYAMTRKNLSAALPGVAIAAALVPPVATVGVSIANDWVSNATGAALLFATNVVAIVVSSSVTLYIVGIRPANTKAGYPLWVRRLMLTLLLFVAVLLVPLTWVILADLSGSQYRGVRSTVEDYFAKKEDLKFLGVPHYDGKSITVRVEAPRFLLPDEFKKIQDRVQGVLNQPVDVHIRYTFVQSSVYAAAQSHVQAEVLDPEQDLKPDELVENREELEEQEEAIEKAAASEKEIQENTREKAAGKVEVENDKVSEVKSSVKKQEQSAQLKVDAKAYEDQKETEVK